MGEIFVGKSVVDIARNFRDECIKGAEDRKTGEVLLGYIFGMKTYLKFEFVFPGRMETCVLEAGQKIIQGGASDNNSNVGETGQREDNAQKKPT